MTTITITFGDCGENHVGMQKIGVAANQGISVKRLKEIQNSGIGTVEFFDLTSLLLQRDVKTEEAGLLIVRKGIDVLLEPYEMTADLLLEEQQGLDWDKKAFMYGRVVNKHARWNLCYADEAQEPDYEKKKGTIVAFESIPVTNHLKIEMEKLLETPLIGEGNYYHTPSKCGIGYHGDAERRIVAGCRLGESMNLHFNWYQNNAPVGENMCVTLDHGDFYIMSDKAVGYDWKKRKIYTLRHAAGSTKFTQLK